MSSSSSELEYSFSSENSIESGGKYLSMSEGSIDSDESSNFGDNNDLFLPYDEDIEPVAMEEEIAAYEQQIDLR
jgi:hypothetical protein